MPTHREMRVHGVSGTPPRQMLGTDPVTLDPRTEHIRIFRRRPPDRTDDASGVTHEFEATAYHWGSLTTGHWLTALWILLSPFAFANVAGWMNSRPSRLTHTTVRLVGVALTALFVAQAGYVFMIIVPRLAPEAWRDVTRAISAAALPALFVWGLVVRLSTQSHFTKLRPGERARLVFSPRPRHMLPRMFWPDPSPATVAGQWDDPAGAKVTDGATWEQHAIVHRLRRIHLAAGCGVVVALYGSRMRDGWLMVAALAIGVVVGALIIATAYAPRHRLVLTATALLPLASLALVAAGWVTFVGDLPDAGRWPPIHVTTFAIALALGATGLAAASAGLPALGAIVTGTLFGASFGVGIELLGEKAVSIDAITERGAGWVVVAMFYLVAFIAGTGALLALRGGPLPKEGAWSALAGRVSSHARTLLVAIALFGLAAGVLAFTLGCLQSCGPEMLRTPSRDSAIYPATIAGFGLVIVLVSLAVARVRRWLGAAFAVVAGGGLALFAMGRLPDFAFPTMELDFNDLVDVSKVIVVLIPTTFVLRSMLGSIRRGTSNRQVGVIWDVASIWPRWFHPLAPPAYGPMVIQDLAHRLVIDPPEILEAQSQGSVIAALAVSQMEEEPGFSLITYGSPIGMLYRPLFPVAGIPELVDEVDARLGGRWLNLWRGTDPIGGAPVGLPDRDVPVRDGSGHSGYESSSDFVEARHRLV